MKKYAQYCAGKIVSVLLVGVLFQSCSKLKDEALKPGNEVRKLNELALPGPYLLQLYPSATAAYSLRRLDPLFNRDCIEVRRGSDGALRTFGFVNDFLDTNAVKEFVGSGNGFVRRWMNQVSTSANLLQTVNANQPLIVENGVLIRYDGEPGVRFTATENQFLASTFLNADGRSSIFGWFSQWTEGMIATVNSNATTADFTGFFTASNTERSRYRNFNQTSFSGIQRRTNLYAGIFDGNLFTMWRNNEASLPVAGTLSTFSSGSIRMGARSSANMPASGIVHAFVVYNNDQTANRAGISNTLIDVYKKNVNYDVRSFLTPDASGGLAGKGFTITGITIDAVESATRTDGKLVLWAGNHGLIQEPPYVNPSQKAGIVKLAIDPDVPDYSTAEKLGELLIFNDANFNGGSIQGVTLGADNTIWFVGVKNSKTTAVYNYSKQGTFIRKFNVSLANGLAYNPLTNQLYVLVDGTNIVTYNTNGTIVEGGSFPVLSGDQLFFNEQENMIYVSRGTNGKAGLYVRYNLQGELVPNETNIAFSRVLAAEGISFYKNLLFFASDAFYHPAPAPNDINAIHVYRVK